MAHSSTAGRHDSARTGGASGHEAFLIGVHIGLCVGLKFDMQFNDDVRVYKGTVTKVKQLRHKTV